MRAHVYFLILFLFFACTAKKSVVKTSESVNVSQTTDIKDSVKSDTRELFNLIDKSTADFDITKKTTEYDTSKPIDKDTGLPPVKAITETTSKKAIRSDVKKDSNTHTVVQTSHTDNSQTDASLTEKSTVIEKSKPPDFKYLFYSIVLILFLVAAFVVYKKFSVIKVFFGKLVKTKL